MRSTHSTSAIKVLAALGSLVLILAACSSSGAASSGAAGSAPGTKPSDAASAVPASSTVGKALVVAVANGAVGKYLTGENGMTLYIFTPDSANKSTCMDACAAKWPPFTVAAADTLKPDASVTAKLSTFARPDGALQVTLGGAPLYYFAADTKAGDTTGQGVGGKWYVASPAGAAASPAGSGKPGY